MQSYEGPAWEWLPKTPRLNTTVKLREIYLEVTHCVDSEQRFLSFTAIHLTERCSDASYATLDGLMLACSVACASQLNVRSNGSQVS